MNVEKKNRLAAAITVAVILFVAILVVVLICQVSALVNKNNEKLRLQQEIRMYEEAIKNAEDELEYLKSQQYLYDLLIQYNYKPKN